MKPIAPPGMRLMLSVQGLAQPLAEAVCAGVLAMRPSQRGHGVACFVLRSVVPALDGRDTEGDRRAARRMCPGAPGERLECGVQRAALGRRCQQRSDDREAKSGPTLGRRTLVVVINATPLGEADPRDVGVTLGSHGESYHVHLLRVLDDHHAERVERGERNFSNATSGGSSAPVKRSSREPGSRS